MSYSATLKITLPSSLADIASAIGKALDPDIGGDKSFTLSEDEKTIVCSTPCRPEFKEQAEYMMLHPEILFKAVEADYATRWPDFKPPSLDDCTLFVKNIIPETIPETIPATKE